MTYYSYPFNNLDINEFWDCFDNLENIDIMDIKSNTLINGKFSKAKCYYKVGTHVKEWRGIEPTEQEFVFQIGEHDNCHGHFFNMDLTDLKTWVRSNIEENTEDNIAHTLLKIAQS